MKLFPPRRVWKRIGKVIAAPVVLPAKAVKKGAEKTMQAAIFGVIRHVLTAAGGSLVTAGYVESSELEVGVGAAMTIIGIVASIINKRRQAASEIPRALYALPIVLALALVGAACGDSPTQPSNDPPVISLFTAEPARIGFLQTATLRWEVLDQDAAVRIDPAPGNVAHVGTYVFTPTTVGTFSFTLTARNKNGTTQRFVTVVVQ